MTCALNRAIRLSATATRGIFEPNRSPVCIVMHSGVLYLMYWHFPTAVQIDNMRAHCLVWKFTLSLEPEAWTCVAIQSCLR